MRSETAEPSLTRVGIYERTLPVSVERVWENVRDWEHLPWLHAGSFAGIECLGEGEWGWRARIGLPGGAHEIVLELVIDADAPRYVSRTVEGFGAGSEIWTRVTERGPAETHVAVEFWLPQVAPERIASLGAAFHTLYTRLWDEDESMMRRRAAELARARGVRGAADLAVPSPVSLGPLPELRARLPLVVHFAGEPYRVVEHGGVLFAHATVCPHRLGPLEDARVEDGRIVCPWHGYAFALETGRECTGRRMRLGTPPRVEVDRESQQVWLSSTGS